MLSLNHGVYIIEKRYKKTVCPDGKYFHQNKLFFIFTLIIFSEHSYFLRKSQITPERKQRKKIFFNSICTPPEHPNSPQSLYLWAFSQFSPVPGHTLLFSKGKIQYPVILHHRCCPSYCKTLLQPTRYYSVISQLHVTVTIYITSTPTSSKHHSTASYRSITHTVSLTRYPTQHQ